LEGAFSKARLPYPSRTTRVLRKKDSVKRKLRNVLSFGGLMSLPPLRLKGFPRKERFSNRFLHGNLPLSIRRVAFRGLKTGED